MREGLSEHSDQLKDELQADEGKGGEGCGSSDSELDV